MNDLKILILYNIDYLSRLDLKSDFLGSMADSSIQNVANEIYIRLKNLGFLKVDLAPIQDLPDLNTLLKNSQHDLVFNLCESLNEGPKSEIDLVKILEDKSLVFTGNNSHCLERCLDKFCCHEELRKTGVPVPQSILIHSLTDLKKFQYHHPKYIVKPNFQDGSIGIENDSVVDSPIKLYNQVKKLLEHFNEPVIIQEYIEGREINLSLIVNASKNFWNFSEISFNQLDSIYPKILNYSSKWNLESEEFNQTITIEPIISEELKEKLFIIGDQTAAALKMSSYGRIDFRIGPNETPYVIDVNPNCDLDTNGGFNKAASYRNIPYESVLIEIMKNGIQNGANFFKKNFTPQDSITMSDPQFSNL